MQAPFWREERWSLCWGWGRISLSGTRHRLPRLCKLQRHLKHQHQHQHRQLRPRHKPNQTHPPPRHPKPPHSTKFAAKVTAQLSSQGAPPL